MDGVGSSPATGRVQRLDRDDATGRVRRLDREVETLRAENEQLRGRLAALEERVGATPEPVDD